MNDLNNFIITDNQLFYTKGYLFVLFFVRFIKTNIIYLSIYIYIYKHQNATLIDQICREDWESVSFTLSPVSPPPHPLIIALYIPLSLSGLQDLLHRYLCRIKQHARLGFMEMYHNYLYIWNIRLVSRLNE